MGFLAEGSPLNWEETKRYADHVRKHGIIQFLNIYHKVKDRQKDVLKWGDEVSELSVPRIGRRDGMGVGMAGKHTHRNLYSHPHSPAGHPKQKDRLNPILNL